MDKQDIIDFLIANKEHLSELIKPFQELRELLYDETSIVFKDDIQKEYNWEVKRLICEMIAMNMAIDTETILVTLEGIDLEEYLK